MNYEIKNANIIVLGAGISGISAARYCLQHGAEVTLYDANAEVEANADIIELVEKYGLKLLLGEKCPLIADWQLAIKSPGIPPTIPFIIALKEADIPVIGELELAYYATKLPFIGITGTNGKTTTTGLCYDMIKAAAIPSILGGNIGRPLAAAVDSVDEGIIVAEVSSFQLEDSPNFAPHISAVLNITPDHLNRHGSMDNYIACKRAITEGQSCTDYAVLNYEDAIVREFASHTEAKVMYFSSSRILEQGAFADEYGYMFIRDGGAEHRLISFAEMKLAGKHNLENALAAALIAYCAGVKVEVIKQVLLDFAGVEHRQEFVREYNGAVYINDSKGTNPDSTIKALQAYDKPIVLIAGGMDKNISFVEMLQIGKPRIKDLVLLGECKEQLACEAQAVGIESIYSCDDFSAAVHQAAALAEPGCIVLLSPACASWDMFKSYEERGRLFKNLVNAL